ncbi:hypothetical protein B484DRAFT_46359 [Ochromonadaceae sp. CCMP2298]|nr:hypothetical protein B484DRAFT_46359 [Ochromonadaceae sp. CCMP2298]
MHVSSSTVLALLCALHCANTASSYAWCAHAPAHVQSQRSARSLSSSGSRLFSTAEGAGISKGAIVARASDGELSALDSAIVITLASRAAEVFAAAGGPGVILTMEALLFWEKQLATVSAELGQLSSQPVLLKVYGSILATAAPMPLDPLQSTSFQLMTNVIMERLNSMLPKGEPVTALIDDITDIHLSFVPTFQKMIKDGDGEDGYVQTALQEQLTYQFAGLVRHTYTILASSLGQGFDKSAANNEMRLNNWVSPVYARLQRRVVRFSASTVEERVEELNNNALDKLIEKLKIQISPRYTLSQAAEVVTPGALPAWELAAFVLKVLRNSLGALGSEQALATLESKVNRMFRVSISARMRDILRPLESVALNQPTFLSAEEVAAVEELVNIGHESVAAVFATWQVGVGVVELHKSPKYVFLS